MAAVNLLILPDDYPVPGCVSRTGLFLIIIYYPLLRRGIPLFNATKNLPILHILLRWKEFFMGFVWGNSKIK